MLVQCETRPPWISQYLVVLYVLQVVVDTIIQVVSSLYPKSLRFVVHWQETMCDFFDYISKAHNFPSFWVRFGVRALPEPEPDLLEPEPMVRFRVRENPPNRTDGPVSGSAKYGKEPNRTELLQHYQDKVNEKSMTFC